MTGRVYTFDRDATNVENLVVLGCRGYTFTFLPANDGDWGISQLCKLLHVLATLA